MKYLFTGGSGMLGQELKQYFPDAEFPTREEFDYENSNDVAMLYNREAFGGIDVIVHMGAFTNTVECETQPFVAISNNIQGTTDIAKVCCYHDIKLVYISTDYVFDGQQGPYAPYSPMRPFNNYGWSKLGGECAVHMVPYHLIIRTSFCANEFPYDKAFVDQKTTRMPVSEAGKRISEVIKSDASGVVHVAGEELTVFELAKSISPNKHIEGISISDMKGYNLPSDTRLRE